MDGISIKLTHDEVKKPLKIMVSEAGFESVAALGRKLGYKDTTFRSALNNNSLRYKDFVKAADLAGFEVVLRKK